MSEYTVYISGRVTVAVLMSVVLSVVKLVFVCVMKKERRLIRSIRARIHCVVWDYPAPGQLQIKHSNSLSLPLALAHGAGGQS